MDSSNPCNAVRESCASFESELAWVDRPAAESFAANADLKEIKTFCFSSHGMSTNRFSEISFPSHADEAGFIFIAHALDFGSGFRPQLHQHRNGQGAWLTIRAGLINLGKMDPTCASHRLCLLTLEEVTRLFDLFAPELEPLARYLCADLHEIGERLLALGYATPGEFIVQNVNRGAAPLVGLLVEMFPLCFRDEYVVRGLAVCFYKKAQLVVSELYMRFAAEIPDFNFIDIDTLTAFVDNVVVAMMRLHGVVQVSSALAEDIANGVSVPKGSEEEVALRSASLTAVEFIVSRLRSRYSVENASACSIPDDAAARWASASSVSSPHVNAQMVCNWLWGCVGKAGSHRSFARHLSPDTSYY